MLTRRFALAPLATVSILKFLRSPAQAQGTVLDLTPACGTAEPTVAQSEGPYFRAGAPQRRDLASDAPSAQRIYLGGLVLDPVCRPIEGAIVQVWHADDSGRYDMRGGKLRGYALTDARGAWSFSTIVPAAYWARTRHYHFRISRPHGPVLTTQLYFPDEPNNQLDNTFDPRLLLRLANEGALVGRYDFVVA